MTPARQQHRVIDGNAVYARLITIDEEAGDLSAVDKELQILVTEIHDGRYDATHTNAPVPEPEYKFTCWKGDCKLHDDCIHSYGQEYPPCVDACAMQAAKAERERDQKQWQKLEDYINANSPWLPGTDDRVTDARKLIAEVRSLRHQQEAEQPKEGWR